MEEPVAAVVAEEAVAEAAPEPEAEAAHGPSSNRKRRRSRRGGGDRRDRPAADEAGGATGGIDQAEMRRRIEETRARLKAKAFEAIIEAGVCAAVARLGVRSRWRGAATWRSSPRYRAASTSSLSQEDY